MQNFQRIFSKKLFNHLITILIATLIIINLIQIEFGQAVSLRCVSVIFFKSLSIG
jgi:hypothetical protein